MAAGAAAATGHAAGHWPLASWLLASDGTALGTRLVVDLNTGGSANPEWLVARGGSLFFASNDGAFGNELWALTLCGDGVVAADEECDAGNATDGDGCSQQCSREVLPCTGPEACIGGREYHLVPQQGACSLQ